MKNSFLYGYFTKILLIGMLMYAIVGVMTSERFFTPMVAVSFLALLAQMLILMSSTGNEENEYTGKRLFLVVLVYTTALATCYMCLSYAYDGDTFLFSKSDAKFYLDNSMKFSDLGFVEGLKYLTNTYDYDDLGGLLLGSLSYYIYPSKFSLNVLYILFGALSSLYLFRIGKNFMSAEFAYLAALSFGISSFWIAYHCSYLKETGFVTVVIATMYHFYELIVKQKLTSAPATLLFLLLIALYRPAVAAFITIGAMVYFAYENKEKAWGAFLMVAALGMLVASYSKMSSTVDKYTAGGDIEGVINYRSNAGYSGMFNYLTSFFAGLFGPFPSYASPDPERPKFIQFYGAGITQRLFFAFPFWLGVWYAIKEKFSLMIPLAVFIIVEMLLTSAVCASLELRKVLPHIPFMYIISFYAFYKLYEEGKTRIPFQRITFVAIMLIIYVWNVLKVK